MRTDEEARKIAKLPVWAQMMIERMERDLADARATIQHFHGDKKSRVVLDPYQRDAPPVYLPERQRIRFTVSDGSIDVMLKEGALEISGDADDYQLNPFVVIPEVSNVIRVGFSPRPSKG